MAVDGSGEAGLETHAERPVVEDRGLREFAPAWRAAVADALEVGDEVAQEFELFGQMAGAAVGGDNDAHEMNLLLAVMLGCDVRTCGRRQMRGG